MARTRSKAEKDLEDDASSRRTIVIDLNIPHPETQEEEEEAEDKHDKNADESPHNQAAAAGGSSSHVIDWNRGSVEFADDGRLQYVDREAAPPPEVPDYASAVHEAQAAEDARRTRIPDDNDEQNVNVDDDDDDGGDVGGYNLWSF